MSYKVKSLLYLAAFIVSAVIYDATNNPIEEKTVAKPEKMTDAITDNSAMEMQEEATLIEDVILKN